MLSRQEVFLPTLDEADWSAYLADLARVPGRLLLANDDPGANPQMLTLLGSRTRFLAHWDQAQGEGPERLIWQTGWQHRGHTLVLSMTAPDQTLVDEPALYQSVVMPVAELRSNAARP